MIYFDVDLTAVLVAAIAGNIAGMIWYSPIMFGKKWKLYMDLANQKTKGAVLSFFLAFLVSLILSYFLGAFITNMEVMNTGEAIFISILLWLGFSAPVTLINIIYEKKPFGLFLINTGYNLVSFIAMGAIHGVWFNMQ